MGKDATPRPYGDKQAGAIVKFVRVPPRKARLVIDAVRGKYATDAIALLKFVPNFAARAIEDAIKSAVANATTPESRPFQEGTQTRLPALAEDRLKVVRAFVDEGPRMKRLQPRAQGRAYRILKRMCHLTVIVEEMAPRPRPVRKPKPAAARRPQAAPRPVAARPEAAMPEAPKQGAVAPEATAPVQAAEPEVVEQPAATAEQSTE